MELMKRDKVDPAMYFKAALEEWTWKNRLYAVPFQAGGEAVMFNRQLFDEAGLKYPGKDWTYDDLLEMGRKLTNPDKKRWALLVGQNYIFYMGGTFVYNFGGKVLNEAKDKAVFAEDQNAVAGTQYNVDLHLKHKYVPPTELAANLPRGTSFIENQMVAMEFNGLFRAQNIRPHLGEKLDFAPPPKGVRQTASIAGNAYSILALSKRKDWAWEFLKWFHTEKAVLETPHFGAISWPSLIWASKHPKWLEPFKGTGINAVVDVWEKDAHDRMVVPEGDQVWNISIEEMNRMIKSEVTVPEGMRTMANRMNELFSRRPAEWR